ncbi:MAG: prepilin-type N-terminal cleavage/methylation domain-containing protein, partial [Zetaproteobacteria bacterium]
MRERKRGFSIVEALVAMAIVAVVLLALAMLLAHNIRTNQASRERLDAAQAAREILADYASKITAGSLACTVRTVCSYQGSYKGFSYTVYAKNNGSSWTLRVRLQP